jgi:hypothetical protein
MRRLRTHPALQLQLPAVPHPSTKVNAGFLPHFPIPRRYKQSMLLFGGVADDDALETSTFFNDVCVLARCIFVTLFACA